MVQDNMSEVATWVESKIVDFVESSPENSLKNTENDPAWATPLVGFARGDDALFTEIKDDIGAFYWTPIELFKLAYPGSEVMAEELAVISWVLPQTLATRRAHRQEKSMPSAAWSRARLYGDQFNELLRREVTDWLQQLKIPAVAPVLLPQWDWQESERYGFASNWSERHTAYVTGLGTFGLSDGLITKHGKAMRCGSVVARFNVAPAVRQYSEFNAYCLYLSHGSCGKCIDRCPAGAISFSGHNKELCAKYIMNETSPWVERNLGEKVSSCGLCQVGIPCESRIPKVPDHG